MMLFLLFLLLNTAKNVILAGLKTVGILDNSPVALNDLGSQFYLHESDLGRPRAAVSATCLSELNQACKVEVITEPLSIALLQAKSFQVGLLFFFLL